LKGLKNITDHSLFSLSSTLGGTLKHLDIRDCYKITDGGLEQIATHIQQLHHLLLDNLPDITDEGIRKLYEIPVVFGFKKNKNGSGLKEISLSNNENISDLAVSYLCSSSPQNLHSLSFTESPKVGSNPQFFSQINILTQVSERNKRPNKDAWARFGK